MELVPASHAHKGPVATAKGRRVTDQPINIGDSVRVIAAGPDAVPLTVEALYLGGENETPCAACRWRPKAQLVHFRIDQLERVA